MGRHHTRRQRGKTNGAEAVARDTRSGAARLLPVLVPVTLAGFAASALATFVLTSRPLSAVELAGLLALLAAACLAEAYPVTVELEGVATGGVSLAAVFIVGTAILHGTAAAVVVSFTALGLVQLAQRRAPLKLVYNAAVYALAAAATGLLAGLVDHTGGVGSLLFAVVIGSSAFYVTNVALVAGMVARAAGRPVRHVLARSFRRTAVPFSIMASVSLMLVVLWERSPVLASALVGPLVAIALYQRSVHDALNAMRLALTDPLTGLGNHRHFHERLQRDLDLAQAQGTPLALCLVDVDDFKQINDRYGHPVGDRVLAQVAMRLRHGGEAFRLGGDEFALLLPGRDEQQALAVAESVLARVSTIPCEHGGHVTVSAGIAVYPRHGLERSELVRVADSTLYWSKENGKSRVRVFGPDVAGLADLRRAAEGSDHVSRFLAATSLARAVDARDAYAEEHSTEVGDLAARVAARLGLDAQAIELIRVAGSLHDVGKLAIPEEILRKPGPLTEHERAIVERHPQIGYGMLDSFDVDPVADWILHHHERWDGDGYPRRLRGDEIPLGARILSVADAYDAMTTDRLYRPGLTKDEALAELERCAGSQFDPTVVGALTRELDEPTQLAAVLAETA